jgi:hypothetical protein
MGENITACRILAGKPKGKKPLGKPGRRWYEYEMKFKRSRVGEQGLKSPDWGQKSGEHLCRV